MKETSIAALEGRIAKWNQFMGRLPERVRRALERRGIFGFILLSNAAEVGWFSVPGVGKVSDKQIRKAASEVGIELPKYSAKKHLQAAFFGGVDW